MQNKLIVSITFLFFILLTIFSLQIPFFWDGTFFSESAVQFFENGYNNCIVPKQVDTGGFPLYSIYLSIVWKIFSKSLLVSHLALLPFLLGITFEYYKLAKRFLNQKTVLFAMIFLLAEPTLITQSILMGYDLIMIYFFLLSLNFVLSKKYNMYSLALTLLCLSSVRGCILGVSLLSIDVIINHSLFKKIKINFFSYLFPSLIIIIWTIYHYQKTGWFFISPERENTHESMVSIGMMFRQFLFISWKITDFGRIVLWVLLISGIIYFYKKQMATELKTLLRIVFIPLITLSIFMIPLSNPIGHKYFIVVFLCLNIGGCYLIQQMQNKILRNGAFSICCLVLFTGSFWLYPERLGNGWDSSLKVLPYFHLKDEMDEFIKNKKIDTKQIGTQYPLIADKKYSHLSDTSYFYPNVWIGPISDYHYFLFTNVINSDISNQVEEVKTNWKLIKSLKSGEVYINLYKH